MQTFWVNKKYFWVYLVLISEEGYVFTEKTLVKFIDSQITNATGFVENVTINHNLLQYCAAAARSF